MNSLPKELAYAEKLMYDGKFKEACAAITNFEKNKLISSEDQLLALILRGRINNYCEQYREAVEIGKIAYSIAQESTIEKFDALLLKANIIFLGKLENALNLLSETEELARSIFDENNYSSRIQADLLLTKSIYYRFTDDINKSLEFALKWMTSREKLAEKLEISRMYWHLGETYLYKSEPNTALDYSMQSLEIQKELGNQIGIAKSLSLVGFSYYSKGDFEQALSFCKQSLAINQISILTRLKTLHLLGAIYKEKGELNRTLSYYNRAVKLAEKENYIDEFINNLMGIGATYRMKGEINKAIEFLKRSLLLSEENNSPYGIISSLFHLTLTNLEKDSLKQAEFYSEKLEKFTNQIGSSLFIQVPIIAKALVLKKSNRIRNFTKAEQLLKQITENEVTNPQLYVLALVNLCDLYLEELNMTNNIEVLEEIKPLITNIFEKAEKQNAYLWLAETKILQAKLALIQMNIEEAKQLLTQAQQIAELHGLELLAIKISNEHDNLLGKLKVWDNLKKINAPMSERIKLASISGVIDRMQGKRAVEPIQLTPENPVLLLIIAEGGNPVFSNSFTEEWDFEDDLISGFLSAFNSFSGEIFSNQLDRAKFGEYTILMNSVQIFSICYLFKGQTYLAKQKFTKFIDHLNSSDLIVNTLKKYHKASQVVKSKDIPALESLITEIF